MPMIRHCLADKKEFRLRNSRAERGRISDIFIFARVRIHAERFLYDRNSPVWTTFLSYKKLVYLLSYTSLEKIMPCPLIVFRLFCF